MSGWIQKVTNYPLSYQLLLEKDAAKSTSGPADIVVLPHGKVSLAGLNQADFRKVQCQKLKGFDVYYLT